MTYPFVQAKYFSRAGLVQARGIVIHMAEGGGTVAWLTHPTNDNSSHFVVESSGRVVQMVAWADADHSLHIARPDGPPSSAADFGMFCLDAAQAVLGTGIHDPNAYLIAIEVEGYAKAGPNSTQRIALKALVATIRAHYPTINGVLGHRDFQNVKACPGGLITWADFGGHGVPSGAPKEAPMKTFDVPASPTLATIKTGAWLYDNSDLAVSIGNVQISPSRALFLVGSGLLSDIVRYSNGHAYWVHVADVIGTYAAPVVDATPFGQAQLDAARAAGAASVTVANAAAIAAARAAGSDEAKAAIRTKLGL